MFISITTSADLEVICYTSLLILTVTQLLYDCDLLGELQSLSSLGAVLQEQAWTPPTDIQSFWRIYFMPLSPFYINGTQEKSFFVSYKEIFLIFFPLLQEKRTLVCGEMKFAFCMHRLS